MINKIIPGINAELEKEFGVGYQIYNESIEQGLEMPCFLITCLNPTNNHEFWVRYKRTNQFMIQYFPSTSDKHSECYDVLEKLYKCLEYIQIDSSLVRGNKMGGEVTDGVLNFRINYDVFMKKELKQDKIVSYSSETKVGG